MILFISAASPFARKARIVVREKQILTQVQEVIAPPLQNPPELIAANPLAQIPALVTDEAIGTLIDSAFISSWLDHRFDSGVRLLSEGEAYWRVRQVEVMANGIIEMVVKKFLEERRPEGEQSPSWLKRWEDNALRAFAVAETLCPDAEVFDMGSLTLAIAGTYCSFRYPHLDWRSLAPRIAALTDACEKRQSFIDTYPQV